MSGSPIYKRPPESAKDPRHIWDEAGLPELADKFQIQIAIDAWAIWHAYLYKKNESDTEFHIQWVTPAGYIIKTAFFTFVQWILCACGQPQA